MLYQMLKPHLFLLEVFQESSEVIGPLRRVLGTWGRQVEGGQQPRQLEGTAHSQAQASKAAPLTGSPTSTPRQ